MICDGDMDGLNSSDKSKVRGQLATTAGYTKYCYQRSSAESQSLVSFHMDFLEFQLDYNFEKLGCIVALYGLRWE
jgi:hypothetical protein